MSSAFKRAEQIKKTAESSLFDEEKPAAVEDSSSSDSDGHQSDSDPEVAVEAVKDKLTKQVKKVLLGDSESKLNKDAEKTDGAGAEDESALRAFKDQDASEKEWKNRQRTLVFCARGVKSKFRDLMDDLTDMLPHCKKENKIERKIAKEYVNELCFQRSCNNCIFLEARRTTDFFMWIMKSPEGPSIKFSVQNIHTADELKMTGNCLKYSRPLLSFDNSFNSEPYLQLMKEMLHQAFNTPKNHPKSKPFIDHVISFSYYQGKVWFRAYQVVNQFEEKFTEKDDIEKLTLIEIGPRFTLVPIKIFDGTMGGDALWQNSTYITPGKLRSRKYD
jgi:ribosome biogenesis protein BRX1